MFKRLFSRHSESGKLKNNLKVLANEINHNLEYILFEKD